MSEHAEKIKHQTEKETTDARAHNTHTQRSSTQKRDNCHSKRKEMRQTDDTARESSSSSSSSNVIHAHDRATDTELTKLGL